MRILFFASYPNLQIGYSRVANIITNYLASLGHEVFYFGISNFPDDKKVNRFVHPSITLIDALEEERKLGNPNELYGVNAVCNCIIDLKPDIFFVYNDVVVISRIFNKFIDLKMELNFKVVTYLDLVYSYEKIGLIKHIDRFSHKLLVFTKYWKDNLIDMGVDENKIDILPHGYYDTDFFPINLNVKAYFNFSDDDFIILNSNRNSYRKCIDKTIDAFVLFLKRKDFAKNIKLYLNMDTKNYLESGYDILNQIQVSCMKYKVDYNTVVMNHIFINETNKLSDLDLNILYNACDVGINTCGGEGFGLCNFEHGIVGKPQIVSNVGGLSDIFDSDFSTKIEPVAEYYISNHVDFHGGYYKVCRTEDFADALEKYYDNKELREEHGKKCRVELLLKYNWKKILSYFDEL